jgi:hypothetical protein
LRFFFAGDGAVGGSSFNRSIHYIYVWIGWMDEELVAGQKEKLIPSDFGGDSCAFVIAPYI